MERLEWIFYRVLMIVRDGIIVMLGAIGTPPGLVIGCTNTDIKHLASLTASNGLRGRWGTAALAVSEQASCPALQITCAAQPERSSHNVKARPASVLSPGCATR